VALAETAKRREVEEAAETLARLGAAEELEKAIEAAAAQADAESASTDYTSPTPFSVSAIEEPGVEEPVSGQVQRPPAALSSGPAFRGQTG